jgi:DNA-binding IclR family transcriptional regulator
MDETLIRSPRQEAELINEDDSVDDLDAIKPAAFSSTRWPELPSSVVKSAGRTLRILEYFDEIRGEAKLVEVARALNFPESSTSILLRSLTKMGYVRYDRFRRTFAPSSRVRLLGNWIDPSLFKNDRIISLMEQLYEESGYQVYLAARNRLYTQIIFVSRASEAESHVKPGQLRPLTVSAAGRVLLSRLSDDEIVKLALHANALSKGNYPVVKPQDLMTEIREVRSEGFALMRCSLFTECTMLAVPVPITVTQDPLAIGMSCARGTMESHSQEMLELLRTRMRETYGTN